MTIKVKGCQKTHTYLGAVPDCPFCIMSERITYCRMGVDITKRSSVIIDFLLDDCPLKTKKITIKAQP